MYLHGIGTKHGQAYALFYQFGGASRRGLPKAGQWLCLKTDAPNMQMKSYTQNTPETYYNRSYCTYSRHDHHRQLFRRHSSVILSLPSLGRRTVRVYQRYKRILRRYVRLHWRRRTDRMLGDTEPKRNPLRLHGWFSRLLPWFSSGSYATGSATGTANAGGMAGLIYSGTVTSPTATAIPAPLSDQPAPAAPARPPASRNRLPACAGIYANWNVNPNGVAGNDDL